MLFGGEMSEAELKVFAIGQTYQPMEGMKNYVHYYMDNNSPEVKEDFECTRMNKIGGWGSCR